MDDDIGVIGMYYTFLDIPTRMVLGDAPFLGHSLRLRHGLGLIGNKQAK